MQVLKSSFLLAEIRACYSDLVRATANVRIASERMGEILNTVGMHLGIHTSFPFKFKLIFPFSAFPSQNTSKKNGSFGREMHREARGLYVL